MLGETITECERHNLAQWPPPYTVVRCAHWGNCFVVEILTSSPGVHYVSYVEDMPDGRVAVESHWCKPDWHERIWDHLNGKMLDGESPDQDVRYACRVGCCYRQDQGG